MNFCRHICILFFHYCILQHMKRNIKIHKIFSHLQWLYHLENYNCFFCRNFNNCLCNYVSLSFVFVIERKLGTLREEEDFFDEAEENFLDSGVCDTPRIHESILSSLIEQARLEGIVSRGNNDDNFKSGIKNNRFHLSETAN